MIRVQKQEKKKKKNPINTKKIERIKKKIKESTSISVNESFFHHL